MNVVIGDFLTGEIGNLVSVLDKPRVILGLHVSLLGVVELVETSVLKLCLEKLLVLKI